MWSQAGAYHSPPDFARATGHGKLMESSAGDLLMADVSTTLTLVGGPTVLIEIGGLRFLTDPTFDPPGTYALPHVTLQKLAGPALNETEVGRIDAVLLSHDQHSDNLDNAGRAFLATVPDVLTTPAGAARLGGNARGLTPWQTVEIHGANGRVHVTATPARHGPVGIEPLSGDVTGFLIGTEKPGDAIYITGDTVWYAGVAEVARRYSPRLVVLFAGAAKTRGAFHLTMDSNDAIEAAHAFPDAQIVAVHNDSWAHFTESREELEQAFAALGLTERLQRLQPGVAVTLKL
jgi:L-ascorbate metabolism protein UlaG (beta-lactamase superfamily)